METTKARGLGSMIAEPGPTRPPDPAARFYPSSRLASLVMGGPRRKADLHPLGLPVTTVQKRMRTGRPVLPQESDCRDLVADRIEGLVVNLVERAAVSAQREVVLANGDRFEPDICTELLFRLGLDPYEARPVYETLYKEFTDFVRQGPRRRSWGRLKMKGKKLLLEVRLRGLPALQPLSNVPDGLWTKAE